MADKPTPLKARGKAEVSERQWWLVIIPPGTQLWHPEDLQFVEVGKSVVVEIPADALASIDAD